MTFAKLFSEHPVYFISNILVIIGALVWLGVGVMGTNYVTKFIPAEYAKYIFITVGIAGLVCIYEKVMLFTSTEKMGNVLGVTGAAKESASLKHMFKARENNLGDRFAIDSAMAHSHVRH